MGCGSRSALTATYNSLAPTSMPAASGCRMGMCHIFCYPSWSFAPPIMPAECPGRGHRANSQSRSPSETDKRHHTSVRNPRPTLHGRASNLAPMSARAVAVIQPAPPIIARLAFLCILSGQGQLHASGYRTERQRSASRTFSRSKNRPANVWSRARLRYLSWKRAALFGLKCLLLSYFRVAGQPT
jgi:hypothetical protein